jgi:hypothetical protein
LRRTRLAAAFLVICPLISGGFFGIVAALLVHWSGSDRALGAGALVGGAMFVANAVALCVVQSVSRSLDAPLRVPDAIRAGELHAS